MAYSLMLSPNYWPGRDGHEPRAIVIHTMQGYLTGTDQTFKDPAKEVSAHFGVGLNGDVHQYVKLADTAWANGILEPGNRWSTVFDPAINPNRLTVSIETEDLGRLNTRVDLKMLRAVAELCRVSKLRFPSITHLARHSDISPISRRRCPGARWEYLLPGLAEQHGLILL